MRACEGCRRRKIKCDAATTNTWPCSACIRLKLHCIPPTVNYDGGQTQRPFDADQKLEYESGGSGDDDFSSQLPMQQHLQTVSKGMQSTYNQQMAFGDASNGFQPINYATVPSNQQPLQYTQMNPPALMESQFPSTSPFSMTQMPPMQPPVLPPQQQPSSPDLYQDPYTGQDLADYLGDLKMDESATGLCPR